MTIVVDASIALTWCFEDEGDAQSDAVLLRVATEGARAASHFALEAMNGLLMAERKGRINAESFASLRSRLDRLKIDLDGAPTREQVNRTIALARTHRLTIYDATYLELAHRLGATLATLDAELRKAAVAEGVAVIP